MAEREVPPPYSDVPKELPLQLQGAYVHPYTPTFEPSYAPADTPKPDVTVQVHSHELPPPYQPQNPEYPPTATAPQVVYQQPPPPPTVYVTQNQPIPGACPVCHNTVWLTHYPLLGWFVAIVFFPIGILCCLMMNQTVCAKCGFRIST